MTVGDEMTWRHETRGGYGYVESIAVRIVKIERTRVQVEAPLRHGGTKRVWVAPTSLQVRRP